MATRQWDALVRHIRRLIGPTETAVQTDRQLLQRFADRQDEAAFALVVERHGPMVLRVCQRLLHDAQEAEDAFQATFCVLARKAMARFWQESIGSWLYAVACRVAGKARTRSARRRQRDREAAMRRSEQAPASTTDPELNALLDVELQRLPEKYRAPLVLCYLEGQTNEEAARQLGWPKGTVQGRLARGRDLLRSRLLRRGLALAGTTLAFLETAQAPAAVPGALLQSTIRTSIQFAAGPAAAGSVPASVAGLAEGVLRTMWLTKLKIAAILLMLAVTGVGAGVFFFGAPGERPQQALGVPLPVDQRQVQQAEPIPFPDGVVDPERRTAFVSSPKGGIQAIRLDDGKVLWSNDTLQAEPWLVLGQRLIARGDRVYVLDTRQEGKTLKKCDAVSFPKVEVPCKVEFQLWGPRVAGDALEANWYGAAHITPLERRRNPEAFKAWMAFNQKAPVGTVKIDLETGKVELRTDPKPADISQTLRPMAAMEANLQPRDLPAKLADVWKQKAGSIARVGTRLVSVALTVEGVAPNPNPSKVVTLQAWDLKTGAAAAPVELVRDRAINIANLYLTKDRRHAAVQFSTSALAIYSLATGKRVGKDAKGISSPESAFIEGTRIYYTQMVGGGAMQTPQSLKALDLESDKVVWERPVKPRDTRPLPP
jgi:RNA polymerase sigma factor (sigma-70 family)